MGKFIRKLVLTLVVLAFLAAWAGVVVTYFTTDGIAAFTVAVTIAAIATEALFWIGAVVGGWTLLASRRAFFARLAGKKAEPEESSHG